MIIERPIYLERIKPFIDKNLIKVIVGQRRVGKSFLLLQIINYLNQNRENINTIYIDKEKYEFDKIKNHEDLINFCNMYIVKDRKNYILIDEIQDIQDFEKALRHFYAFENIDIYCTGSNAKLLSGELATFLSGRYIEIKVYSLSYLEFLNFHNLENSDESLEKYLRIGGLPYIINLQQEENVIYEYLNNIFSTIIYKDIISRYNIRNHYFLENLVKYLSLNTGTLVSSKRISDYLKSQKIKMSPQIVLDYLAYLENAFLIFKVKRTDLTGRKIFEINEKYYFEDLGIKNAIIGQNNYSINQIIENVIFNHLKICQYHVKVGVSGDKEIDFVCERNGNKVYIQAAYLIPDEHVVKREYGNLLEIRDNYRKLVVSLDKYAPKNIHGIEHILLKDFLTNFK